MIAIDIMSQQPVGKAWPYYRLFIDEEERNLVSHAISPQWLDVDITKDERQYSRWMSLKNSDKREAWYGDITQPFPTCSDCKQELIGVNRNLSVVQRGCRCERQY